MGFGRKRKDAAEVLGRLKAEPWEREPLTEIQPFREGAAQLSDPNDRETVEGAHELLTK